MDHIKCFDDFIEEGKLQEFDGGGQILKYRYLDYFKKQYFDVRCELISYNEKTAKIKLLGFGPKGVRPGTIMTKVKHKSLVGFKPDFPKPDNDDDEEEPWWNK